MRTTDGIDHEFTSYSGDGFSSGSIDFGDDHDVSRNKGVAIVVAHRRHAMKPIGLEDGHHPAPGVALIARGGEYRSNLSRKMRVVIDKGGVVVGRAYLKSSVHTSEIADCSRRSCRRHPERLGHRKGSKKVAHVVQTAQRQVHGDVR